MHTQTLRDFFGNKHINSTTAITSKQCEQLIVQGTKDWHLVSPCKRKHTQSPESLVNPQHWNLTISSNNMPTKRGGTTSSDSKGIEKTTGKKKELIIRKFMTQLYLEHPSLGKLLWSFDFEKPGFRLALQKQDQKTIRDIHILFCAHLLRWWW